jgi:hypothetical protein
MMQEKRERKDADECEWWIGKGIWEKRNREGKGVNRSQNIKGR